LSEFFSYIYQVVEHGLGHLPFTEKQVITPTGKLGDFCFCSVVREFTRLLCIYLEVKLVTNRS